MVTNGRIGIALLIGLSLVVAAAFWWDGRSPGPNHEFDGVKKPSKPPPSAPGQEEVKKGEGESEARNHRPESRISDLEFHRIRVVLPKPMKTAWQGAVFTSDNFNESRRKRMVVEVLPGWIRKALWEGNTERAAGYLWSLQTLANDADPATSSEAVLEIYRLGDIDGFAHERMAAWIKDGWDYKTGDSSFGQSEYMDIRARVLRELSLTKDSSLDDLIFEVWVKEQTTEKADHWSVDYAYYLQKHGRKLPDEYWVRRLENTSGFYHALEVAEQNGGAVLIPKLNEVFEKLRKQGKTPPAAASWAASTAAALFRQTGDARHLEYLEEQARRQLAGRSFEQNLAKVLEGLAASGDRGAFDLVSSALGHRAEGIREKAMDALSKSGNPAACGLLFETAIERAKQGKGFPSRELLALIMQGSPDADFKYERLKQALLNGQLGWNAVISDFDVCEFLRKHSIHHSSYH